MRVMTGLVLLSVVCRANPVGDAANAVLAEFRAKKDLKPLAAKDDPDPWTVADDLCSRGEFDAAEAFAKAAPRPDTLKLPAYVAHARTFVRAWAVRGDIRKAWMSLLAKNPKAVLKTLEGLDPEAGSLAALHCNGLRANALGMLGKPKENVRLLRPAAVEAERIGWLRGASGMLAACVTVATRYDPALARRIGDQLLTLDERRGDRRAVAKTLRKVADIHDDHGEHAKAIVLRKRSLALSEEIEDRVGIARDLVALGSLVLRSSVDMSEGFRYLERALEYRDALPPRERGGLLCNLGVVAHKRGDLPKALKLLVEARDIAGETGYEGLLGTSLRNLGICYSMLGRERQALDCYRQALPIFEKLGGTELAALLHSRGVAEAELGLLKAAHRSFERSLRLAEKAKDVATQANALSGLSRVHRERSEWEEAIRTQKQALRLRASRRDTAGVAWSFDRLAAIELKRGDYERARVLALRSVRMLRQLRSASLKDSLANLGAAELSCGLYAEALAHLEEALALFPTNSPGVATALVNLGGVYSRIGDTTKALAYFRRAHEVFLKHGRRPQAHEALYNLGVTHYLREEFEQAESVLRRCEPAFREAGDKRQLARTWGMFAQVEEKRGDLKAAEENHLRAIKAFEEIGQRADLASVLGNLGKVYLQQGRGEEALRVRRRGLALAREVGDRRTQAMALWGLAIASLGIKDPKAAVGYAEEAIELLPLLTGRLSSEQGAQARDEWLGVFLYGARAARQIGDPALAFRFLEAGRAATLIESLQLRPALRSTMVSPALLKQEAATRAREAAAHKRYIAATDAGSGAETAWKEVESARAGLEAVSRKIQREAKRQADLFSPGSTSLSDVQASLGEGEALVVYTLADTEAWAVLVLRGSIRMVTLGPSKPIREAAKGFRTAVARPDERGMRLPEHQSGPYLSKQLRKHLIDPLGLTGKTKRLLISPDWYLAYLPFAVWTDRELVYVPSGSTYRLLMAERDRRGKRVLALGDPDYQSKRPNTVASTWRGGDLAPLPHSADEAKAVGDVVLLGKAATTSGLREALRGEKRWRAVHFACHGLIDEERPILSALALSPSAEDSGFLRCLDIFRMKIPADLVVLSACETGKGKIYKAEGVIGWTRAFLFAGAPRVIVSLWKVDDAATRALMEKFYALWKDSKMPAAEALKKAQVFVRSQERWKHPYFWAAWQLWGLGG